MTRLDVTIAAAADVLVGDVVSRGGPDNAFRVTAVLTPTPWNSVRDGHVRLRGASHGDLTLRAGALVDRYDGVPHEARAHGVT